MLTLTTTAITSTNGVRRFLAHTFSSSRHRTSGYSWSATGFSLLAQSHSFRRWPPPKLSSVSVACLCQNYAVKPRRGISTSQQILDIQRSSPIHTTISRARSTEMNIQVQFANDKDVTDILWPVNSNVSSSDGAEKPLVVILLGWAGSSHKNLSKYSDEYLKRGCVVVRYICPAEYTIFQTGRLPQAAHAVLQKLKDEGINGNPTFIHAFSNNGSVMYSHLLREFARCQDDILVDLRGTIIDSAPVRRIFGPFLRMLPTLMPTQLGLLRYPAAGLITFVLALWTTVWYIRYAASMVLLGESVPQPLAKSSSLKEAIPLHNWLKRIVGIRNHPFLFLYSSADDMATSSEIVNIAEAVRSRGNPAKLVDFQDSKHCQHFRKHEKEYFGHIQNFVKSTMESSHGQPKYWDELE